MSNNNRKSKGKILKFAGLAYNSNGVYRFDVGTNK